MTVSEATAVLVSPGQIERTKNILIRPKSEWNVIATEQISDTALWRRWAVILAAIGPVSSVIGMSIVGVSVFGARIRLPILDSILSAAISYAAAMLSVLILAKLIELLADKFGAIRNANQALKLAVFSSIPAWLAGILTILPSLTLLATLGVIYGLYLLYTGLVPVMHAPLERKNKYAAAVIISAVVIFFAMGAITSALMGAL